MNRAAESGAGVDVPAHSLVTLHDIGLRYPNGVQALAGLTLEVRAGEFVSILGPSGCGKSTALRIVAGLLQPTNGVVRRHLSTGNGKGRERGRDRGRGNGQGQMPAGRVGFVFQEPTLTPWSRTLANVRLPLDLAGMARSEADARAAAMLAMVGLAGFERAYPRELSGGMRMRASIARAMATRPDLLLMDEPFAALDEFSRFRLNDDLLALQAELGFTVIFVTHSIWESVYLSDRIVVMSARPGRIIGEALIEAPAVRSPVFRASPGYASQCAAMMSLAASANGAGSGVVW